MYRIQATYTQILQGTKRAIQCYAVRATRVLVVLFISLSLQ